MRIGELFVDLTFRRPEGLEAVDRGLTRTERGLRRLDRRLAVTEKRLRGASRAAFGMGAALTGGLIAMSKAAADLEAQIASVAARTGIAAGEIRDGYVDALRGIGAETGLADVDLLEGLQRALSAGLRDDDALAVVEAGAKAAAAGIGAIEDQVSSATTLVHLFGLEGGEALDIIARAAQVGEGDSAAFAQSLKGLGALAAELGLEATDAAAGLAAISQVAPSVAEGETQARAFLRGLLKPSAMARAEVERLGTSFDDLREVTATEGLAAVLRRVRELGEAGGPEALGKLFESSEALQFVLNVSPEGLEALSGDVAATYAGTIDRAFAEGEGSVTRGVQRLTARVRHLFQRMGDDVRPAVSAIIGAVTGLVDWLGKLPAPLRSALAHLTLLGAPLIGLAGGLRLAAGAVALLRGNLGRLATLPAGPLGGITARVRGLGGAVRGVGTALRGVGMVSWIAAAGVGLAMLIIHWDKVRDAIRRAWSAALDYFSTEGQHRREKGRTLEAQAALVETLEAQLALLQEQNAPMAEQLELARRIKRERAEELRVQGELAELEARRAKAVASDVMLPQLQGERERINEAIETAEGRLERGFFVNPRGSRIELDDADRARTEAQLVRLRSERRLTNARIAATYRSIAGTPTASAPAALLPGGDAPEGGATVTSILGDDTGPGAGDGPGDTPKPTAQPRVPPPERVEVHNADVVRAIHGARIDLVHELRVLGVLLRGGELPAHLATRSLVPEAPQAPRAPEAPDMALALPPAPAHAMAGLIRALADTPATPAPQEALQAPVTPPDPFHALDQATEAAIAAQAHSSTSYTSTTSTRTVNAPVDVGGVTVNAAPGQSPEEVAEAVTERIDTAIRDQWSDLLEDSDSKVVR